MKKTRFELLSETIKQEERLDVYSFYKLLSHNELTGNERNKLIIQVILLYTERPYLYEFSKDVELEYLLAALVVDLFLDMGTLTCKMGTKIDTFAAGTLHTILERGDAYMLFEIKVLLHTLAQNKELADCLILFNKFFLSSELLKNAFGEMEGWINPYEA